MAFWEISPLALLCTLNNVLCMAKWEISNISPFSLTHWLLKPWHFGKFCHWPCFMHYKCVSCMVKHEISIISPLWFGALAVKARAFSKISLFSHQNLLFPKLSKQVYKFNTPAYGLHFGSYNMGTIGVKIHHFYANCHINQIYKYGYCPGHMYIGYGMLVEYQIVIYYVSTLIPIAFTLYVM